MHHGKWTNWSKQFDSLRSPGSLGIVVGIKSLTVLFEDLKTRYGLSFITTAHLNQVSYFEVCHFMKCIDILSFQDALENFFSQLRGH